MEKYLKENEDGSITIDFTDRPLTIDGTKVNALTMREPDVEDQLTGRKQGGGDEAESEIAVFANLTEQSPDTIRKLKLRQYARLQRAYEVFLV